MPAIHEVATLTSKGQITLPKPIRQAWTLAASWRSRCAVARLS
ncbi:AbrB/MazE/SpoVT family DNA-binding domain-containing protein [Achromobacter pulmonis]